MRITDIQNIKFYGLSKRRIEPWFDAFNIFHKISFFKESICLTSLPDNSKPICYTNDMKIRLMETFSSKWKFSAFNTWIDVIKRQVGKCNFVRFFVAPELIEEENYFHLKNVI